MATTTAYGTCFTTPEGIFTFRMDEHEVLVRFRSDAGTDAELSIPSFKFAWVVRDFLEHIEPK